MRAIFLSFLTALTLLTSVGLGHARGVMPAEEGIVICQGHLVVTVWIDAQGNEVTEHHICPEAALSLLTQAAVDGPRVEAPWAPGQSLAAAIIARLHVQGLAPSSHARGPPFAI
ncbi:MAG: hypothetical protein AAGF13_00230 [Pseudomonadota bacterium]